MAGFSGQNPEQPIVGINVTPLVDITLVLLIIFMVTAKLVVSRALPLDLPKAATGSEVQQLLSVAVSADGALSVDGESVADTATLSQKARAALASHTELRAVIAADAGARHERVMAALDALRAAGLARVAFAVTPKPPEQR
jgi:biopolymer transport protein ExbD